MKQAELIRRIHETVNKANDKYTIWSGGWTSADSGIEGFIVSELANSIMSMKNPPAYLTLETQLKIVFDYQGRRPKGRPKQEANEQKHVLSSQKRLDIVLYNKSDSMKYAIEVKRRWSENECFADIDELCLLLQHFSKGKGSFVAGIFVLLTETKNIENYKSKVICYLNQKKYAIGKNDLSICGHKSSFSSLCLVIK